MSLVVPNAGEVKLLEYLVNAATPTDLVIHLYAANVGSSPVDLSGGSASEAVVVGNFSSLVPENDGYPDNGVVLSSTIDNVAQWVITTESGGISSAAYASGVTFTFEPTTNATTVWGYYVTDTNITTCLWAEEFSGAPFILPAGGGQIAIKPQIQLD